MYIRVNVIAGAKRELVKRISPDRYAVSVREPAERNMANTRVKEVLAGELGISAKAIRLISGHTSPHKIFSVPLEISH